MGSIPILVHQHFVLHWPLGFSIPSEPWTAFPVMMIPIYIKIRHSWYLLIFIMEVPILVRYLLFFSFFFCKMSYLHQKGFPEFNVPFNLFRVECVKEIKVCIIPPPWNVRDTLKSEILPLGSQYPCYIVNTMDADGMVMEGARATVSLILTYLTWNNLCPTYMVRINCE